MFDVAAISGDVLVVSGGTTACRMTGVTLHMGVHAQFVGRQVIVIHLSLSRSICARHLSLSVWNHQFGEPRFFCPPKLKLLVNVRIVY